MDPFPSGRLQIDLGDGTPAVAPGTNGTHPAGYPPAPDPIARRADIDAKQEQVARLVETMGCEAVLLLSVDQPIPQDVIDKACDLQGVKMVKALAF